MDFFNHLGLRNNLLLQILLQAEISLSYLTIKSFNISKFSYLSEHRDILVYQEVFVVVVSAIILHIVFEFKQVPLFEVHNT